jgi:hypothetical protein
MHLNDFDWSRFGKLQVYLSTFCCLGVYFFIILVYYCDYRRAPNHFVSGPKKTALVVSSDGSTGVVWGIDPPSWTKS